mgnify:CR=1 FL=1
MKKMENRNKKKARTSCLIAWLLVLSMAFPLLPPVVTSQAAGEDAGITQDYDAMDIADILKLDKSLTWVFAGDSITHNATWSQGMNSYSEWFEQYLYDINRRDDSVILTAWGGADIYDFQTRETEEKNEIKGQGTSADPGMGLEQMITKYNPDVVFIKLGMNDRYRTTARYEQYYEQMLNDIYAAGAVNGKRPKIVLLTPTPISGETIYNTDQEDADSIWRFQKSLTKIAEKRGLLLCDLATAFTQEALAVGSDYHRLFFTDPSDGGVHPNAAGQYLIFKSLSKTLGIYDETMPIYQLQYRDMNSAALYVDETYIGKTAEYDGEYGVNGAAADSDAWSQAVRENNLWMVAGGTQMSGYQGPVVNRSLFRCIDNVLRSATCLATNVNNSTSRDNRMVSVAAPGRTVAELNAKYETLIARQEHQVFLLLPEVPEVYGEEYLPSPEELQAAVAEYKATVTELLAREAGKVRILWTPLASADERIDTYLGAYAEAVREIAKADGTILFFDAYKFMNEKMAVNESLKRNWFEDDGYLSPLGALDAAYGFHCYMKNVKTDGCELNLHNLRLSTDARVFKGDYVRDLIPAEVSVAGTTVTVDTAPIRVRYPELTNLRLVLLPGAGAGNYHEDIRELEDVTTVTENNGVYIFEAPCADPVLAIYGEQAGKIYRFRDLAVKVTTDRVVEEEEGNPTEACLDSLTVVGAPAIGFAKDKTVYEVSLYQYQRNVQILAEAQKGLTITVNDVEVKSGAYSGLIPVDETATVTVKVSGVVKSGGTAEGERKEAIYTLNLTRPENPDIIITEVMSDGYYQYESIGGKKWGADNYELIEIYNASGRKLNLLDYSIGFKTSYTYVDQITSGGKYPYYFTGNDQAFPSTHSTGKVATYTGINQITKYSSYWADGSVQEPEEVLFPADSTMVIWVKSSPGGATAEEYGKTLTYDTLRAALEKHKGTHTLTVDVDGEERAVVPAEEQLVVAEVPMGFAGRGLTGRAKQTPENANKHFLLGNVDAHAQGVVDGAVRSIGGAGSWLFVLKDTAEQAQNGAITEAGDDIISAARYVRPGKAVKKTASDGTVSYVAEGTTYNLSSVLSYDSDRGMSLVKDEAYWNPDTIGQAHTSDQQGYSNLTSFGAIEYWQKPKDLADETEPSVQVTASLEKEKDSININLDLTDNEDLRYIELKVWGNDPGQAAVLKKDLVLLSGMKNNGVSADIKSYCDTWSVPVPQGARSVSYEGYVEDGNGNQTKFDGSCELEIPTEPVIIRYNNIKEYRGADGYTHPELDGFVFAGWYTSKLCQAPVGEGVKRGSAYAKFVPKEILSVKAQVTANLLDGDDTNDDAGAIRFVTSVDTLRYKEVGFLFDITGNASTLTRSSDIVYDTLYAVDPRNGVVTGEENRMTYTPQATFCSMSAYFKAFTFYQLTKEDYAKEFKVTPFWITLDGTTVYGTPTVKSVNQGINELKPN